MIGIINYRAGNSQSVKNTLEHLHIPCKMLSQESDFENITAIILPGVGSAKATMESLEELGILPILNKLVLIEKIPFMGICVGLQVLFEHSEEGDVECLGWLNGRVKQFDGTTVKVPQIGWNEVVYQKESHMTTGNQSSDYLYFVNSYHVVPEDNNIILGVSHYGNEFVAMVEKENIFAAQCHIEKSGPVGLRILEKFATLGDAYCVNK